MDVDVIIPTFNRAQSLERAISSVLNQTHRNFTLFVVDDASTDETPTCIQQFNKDPRFNYHQLDLNSGVSIARNIGVQLGQSKWIAFLDSDDEWLPQKLETQLNFHRDHAHFDFIHSEEMWIRNGVRVNPKLRYDKRSQLLFERSLELCLISPSTVLMKRELFNEQNGFDPHMTVCEDYDLWLRILLKEEVGFIPTPLIKKYGGHSDQLSIKYKAMDYWRIKSLVKLLSQENLKTNQKESILRMIKIKSDLLLANLKKHNQSEMFQEISSLLCHHNIQI